jgi:hypothetical protein
MKRWVAACGLVALLGSGPAWARMGEDWGGPAYEAKGVRINIRSVTLKKGKMWFELSFINNTDKTLSVDPDQLQAKTPDGKVLTREKGVFDKLGHKAITLSPHAGGDVNVEFLVGQPNRVDLALFGVALNSSPVALPDLTVKPLDRDWEAAPLDASGLKVTVTSARPSGKEGLSIKLTILNNTADWIGLDRDQTRAKLPDGALVSRDKGLLDKAAVVTIKPHETAEVALDYKVGRSAEVAVALAAFANGKQLELPPLVLKP